MYQFYRDGKKNQTNDFQKIFNSTLIPEVVDRRCFQCNSSTQNTSQRTIYSIQESNKALVIQFNLHYNVIIPPKTSKDKTTCEFVYDPTSRLILKKLFYFADTVFK